MADSAKSPPKIKLKGAHKPIQDFVSCDTKEVPIDFGGHFSWLNKTLGLSDGPSPELSYEPTPGATNRGTLSISIPPLYMSADLGVSIVNGELRIDAPDILPDVLERRIEGFASKLNATLKSHDPPFCFGDATYNKKTRKLTLTKKAAATRQRITSDADHQSSPAWAPDGSLIAYCSLPVTAGLLGSNDIWVIEPDGNNPTKLTDGGESCRPAWSPDSSQIAFTAYVFSQDVSKDHSDVWIMNRDGSEPRTLTNDPTRFDRAPAWSPDGSLIAFDSAGPIRVREDPAAGEVIEHNPPTNIHLVNVAGGAKTRLTTGSETDAAAAWQPRQ